MTKTNLVWWTRPFAHRCWYILTLKWLILFSVMKTIHDYEWCFQTTMTGPPSARDILRGCWQRQCMWHTHSTCCSHRNMFKDDSSDWDKKTDGCTSVSPVVSFWSLSEVVIWVVGKLEITGYPAWVNWAESHSRQRVKCYPLESRGLSLVHSHT